MLPGTPGPQLLTSGGGHLVRVLLVEPHCSALDEASVNLALPHAGGVTSVKWGDDGVFCTEVSVPGMKVLC